MKTSLPVLGILLSLWCVDADAAIVPQHFAAEGPAEVESAEPTSNRPKRFPPFLWIEKNPERGTRFAMFAMLYWNWESPEQESTLFVPLVFTRENKRENGRLVVIPVASWYRSPSRSWVGILHVVYRYEVRHGERGAEKTVRVFMVPVWRNRAAREARLPDPP